MSAAVRVLIASSFLSGACVATAQAPQPDAAAQAPFYAGISDSATLRTAVGSCLARADGHLKTLLAIQSARTVNNTLVPYDRMWTEIAAARSLAGIVARLNPDESVRTTAEALGREIAATAAALTLRPEIHAALKGIDLLGSDAVVVRYVARELGDGQLAGVDRPAETRARLAQLREQLQAASQDFNRNLLSGQRRIVASASELGGLPADFIEARKPDPSGSITLTTDDADLAPVLMYASNESLRRRLQMERWTVAVPQNVTVLEQQLSIRHEIATVLGYPTWAEYHAQPRMAGTAKAVADFIDRVFTAAGPAAAREYGELLARKRQDVPDATRLNWWDRAYYGELVRRTRYGFDSQSLRPYFSYGRVQAGVMNVAGVLFEVSFRPAPGVPTWHPDVRVYEVLQRGTLIGRVYLDVHQRPQKANAGASAATVRRGVAGVQIPEVVLIASVPGGVTGEPGLMTHDQVRTLFHEFGHVMHAIVGGQGRWHGLSGIDIEGDVAEAPSTMLEEWIWDARTLATFARHYQTDEPIPASLVQQMRRAGEFGRGLDAQRQAYLSRVSFSLHDGNPIGRDSTGVVRDVWLKYNNLFPWVEGAYLQAQFTHLSNGNYTSAYYTYLWSRVVAKDLFSQFNSENLLATDVARRYRDAVLAPGGAKPAADLIRDFLGRPFGFEAYEKWLNGESGAATR
jgi:thimet oligopeptidase